MNKPVFNLEFPTYVHELKIADYKFTRIEGYATAYSKLQHMVNSSGSEFSTKIQDGSHQMTAIVEIPEHESPALLKWASTESTQLADVMLLLSIFTGRSTFIDMDEDGGAAVLQDHRCYTPFGGELCLSLPVIPMCREKSTGKLLDRSAMANRPMWEFEQLNTGFEKGLNQILELIQTADWKKKYEGGHFLFIYAQAIRRQIIETSFILCWSIWEHLFALHNKSWMSTKSIREMGGEEKIKYVYDTYLGGASKVAKEFSQLVKTRNRIVHYGMPVDRADYDSMERFIRTTERVIAVILGLKPSEKLEGAEELRKMFG